MLDPTNKPQASTLTWSNRTTPSPALPPTAASPAATSLPPPSTPGTRTPPSLYYQPLTTPRDILQNAFGLQACVPVCTNVQGYVFNGQPATGSQLPASANPAPIMPGIVATCTTFEFIGYVGASVGISDMLAANNISDAQFRQWNTQAINNDGQTWVWAGYYVCVAAT